MFENPACGIDVDVSHSIPGYTQTTVKVYKNDQPSKRFAFMAGRGLVRLWNSEKAEVEDILGQLLSIRDADDDILSFIKDNGYLLPIVVSSVLRNCLLVVSTRRNYPSQMHLSACEVAPFLFTLRFCRLKPIRRFQLF